MNKKRINELMTALGCTHEEAIEMIKEDEAIDKMSMSEVNSDLTDSQKKAIKSVTKVGTKKKTKINRERKIDEVKKQIINNVRVLIEGMGAVTEPLKNETDLHFTYEDNRYSIKLTKHRPPKK